MMANQHGPSPFGARDANSPNAGVMCRPGHRVNVCPAAALVNPLLRPAPHSGAMAERIETRAAPFPDRGICAKTMEAAMDQRIVQTPTEARQGSKSGIVRYVLAISTALGETPGFSFSIAARRR